MSILLTKHFGRFALGPLVDVGLGQLVNDRSDEFEPLVQLVLVGRKQRSTFFA